MRREVLWLYLREIFLAQWCPWAPYEHEGEVEAVVWKLRACWEVGGPGILLSVVAMYLEGAA